MHDGAGGSSSNAAASAQRGLADPDGHVVALTVSRRALLGATAGIVAGAALLPAGRAGAAGAEPGASYFEPVDPRRLCDTRAREGLPAGYGYQRVNGLQIRVGIAGNGGIPSDAVAAVLTVTGVGGGVVNYLSAFPAGEAWQGTFVVFEDRPAAHQRRVPTGVAVRVRPLGGPRLRSAPSVS